MITLIDAFLICLLSLLSIVCLVFIKTLIQHFKKSGKPQKF